MSSALLRPACRRMKNLPANLELFFFEPRFLNDQVAVRAQSWILISGEKGSLGPRIHHTIVCAHLRGASHEENSYAAEFKSKLEHLVAKQDSCEQCRSLISCEYCLTEVYVDVEHFDKDYVAGLLVITKWQLLGRGLSPSETHWNSHLHNHKSMAVPSRLWARKYSGSLRGSARDQV